MNTTGSLQTAADQQERLSELRFNPHLIKNVLQEHEETQQRMRRLGERKLSLGLKIFLWGLRLYVGFMVVVVIINVSQSIH
jgi:hypothetical protein